MPVAVALHPSHDRSCTRLMQTERASTCLFANTWDCTWRNRPCTKLPTHPRKSPAKIPPKSQIQPPFGQLANNIPQTPSPRPPPLHSLRQSRPPCRADTSAPRFVEGMHGDPLAPTVCSHRLLSSSRVATSGYVLVEAQSGQRRHHW